MVEPRNQEIFQRHQPFRVRVRMRTASGPFRPEDFGLEVTLTPVGAARPPRPTTVPLTCVAGRNAFEAEVPLADLPRTDSSPVDDFNLEVVATGLGRPGQAHAL